MSPILGIVASQNYVRIPPSSYESIATVTGNGSSSTLTFSSIPSTYTSLQIRAIGRDTNGGTAAGNLLMRFNSDSGANYSRHNLRGTGATVAASGATGATNINLQSFAWFSGTAANTFGAAIVDIHDYASTTKNKTVRAIVGVNDNGASGNEQIALASAAWFNTAAVNTITLVSDGTAFATGTVFSLYGIKGA